MPAERMTVMTLLQRGTRITGTVGVIVTLGAFVLTGGSSAFAAKTHSPASGHQVRGKLTKFFDNVGIATRKHASKGNLDGVGSSFIAADLAADHAAPGATISYRGVKFSWPNVAAGKADNVVAQGQQIRIVGSGTVLAFLVTAGYGPAKGVGSVVFRGGSAMHFTLRAPDWFHGCSRKGANVVLYTPSRNAFHPHHRLPACVYYASVRLPRNREVVKVILPKVSHGVVAHKPSLHIFAITIH